MSYQEELSRMRNIQIGLFTKRKDEAKDFYFRTQAMKQLLEMSQINTPRVIFDQGSKSADEICECDAIICRPNWGGEITDEVLQNVKEGFYVATLSVGTDHIKLSSNLKKLKKVNIIRSKGGNAHAVAELTLLMAICLRRRIFQKAVEMGFGNQRDRNYSNLGTLKDCTWTLLGRGYTARNVLVRLLGFGLKRIVLWNRSINRNKFEEVFSNVKIIRWESEENGHPNVVVGDSGKGFQCLVEGTSDLDYALRQGDIISIHLNLVDGTNGTKALIDKEKLSLMKKEAVLINVSRGEIIKDEKDIIKVLSEGRLGGFATDVLNRDVESDEGKTNSLAWQGYCNNILSVAQKSWRQRQLRSASINALERIRTKLAPNFSIEDDHNILVTQHIGGMTPDIEEEIAREVIENLLSSLKLDS